MYMIKKLRYSENTFVAEHISFCREWNARWRKLALSIFYLAAFFSSIMLKCIHLFICQRKIKDYCYYTLLLSEPFKSYQNTYI